MKKKLLAFTCLIAFSFTVSKYLVIEGITQYQKNISPHKGWKCAYAMVNSNETSCSQYAKESVSNYGIFEGLKMLKHRFSECGAAFNVLKQQHKAEGTGDCSMPPITPLLVDGSKAEGTLTFAYEYSGFLTSTINWDAAHLEAAQRCKSWGFNSHSFFQAGVTTLTTNNNYRVVYKCQCTNLP